MSDSESENHSESNEMESSGGEEEASDVDDASNPNKTEEESVSWKDLVRESAWFFGCPNENLI